MTAKWQETKIKDIAVVDWGNTNLTKKAYVEGGQFLGVSAAGCDGRMSHAEHKKFTPVLSAIGAQCGRMFMPNEDFTAIKNTITLTPIEGRCDPFFLFYLLNFIELPQRGAGQPFISKGDIQKFPVKTPTLPEQKRIVAILDEAFAGIDQAIANTEKNLASIRELFESYLNTIFTQKGEGWEERKLEEICSVEMGQSPSGKSYNKNGDGPPLINGPDEFGGIEPFSKTLATKFTTEPKKMCEVGDIILCVRGSTTGRMNIAGHASCIGRGVAAIRAKDNQDWVAQFMSFSKNRIYEMGTGSTFPNVSSAQLKKMTIPLPPKNLRAELVYKILEISEKSNSLENTYRQKIASLNELKQSLLQKAFSGELTADMADEARAEEVA